MKNTTDNETRKVRLAKLFLLVALSAATFAANAQNSTRTQSGNFTSLTQSKTTAASDSTTTFTYTDAGGKIEPVYKGSRGGYYVARTSKKTGNYYRKYLKTED